MTQTEINQTFNIPPSTLKDWGKSNHPKHSVFLLLKNLEQKEALNISTRHKRHRIFHILNRNIIKSKSYSFDEVALALNKNEFLEVS